MEPTILTLQGQLFDYRAPELHRFDIEEIAHALSNLCRFTGHTRSFYSVAQHSVLVCDLAPPEHKLEALLPMYREVEQRVEAALRSSFELSPYKSREVKLADLAAYQIERFVLMPDAPGEQHEDPPHPYPLHPLQPRDARDLFLARWQEVRHG